MGPPLRWKKGLVFLCRRHVCCTIVSAWVYPHCHGIVVTIVSVHLVTALYWVTFMEDIQNFPVSWTVIVYTAAKFRHIPRWTFHLQSHSSKLLNALLPPSSLLNLNYLSFQKYPIYRQSCTDTHQHNCFHKSKSFVALLHLLWPLHINAIDLLSSPNHILFLLEFHVCGIS
jgi:hypothetical protein